jgi:hypothetical protein
MRAISFVAVVSLATIAVVGAYASTASAATLQQQPTVTTGCASAQQQQPTSVTTSTVIVRVIAALCSDLEGRLGVTTLPPVPPVGTPPPDLIEYTLIGVLITIVAPILF